MSRLFMFGCSFTRYLWPTWANILEYDRQCPSEIWAFGGRGNIAISHTLLEAYLTKNITIDDKIIINWSSWPREDRYNRGWWAKGGVWTGNEHTDDFRENYWSVENDCMKNLSAIVFANMSIPIDYQSHMCEYEDNLNDEDVEDRTKFDYLLNKMPEKIIFDMSTNTHFDGYLASDYHPDVYCHIQHADRVCRAVYNESLKQTTVDYYEQLHYTITDMLKKDGYINDRYEYIDWPTRRKFFARALGEDFYEGRPRIGI